MSSGVIELRLPDHGDYYSDITIVAGWFLRSIIITIHVNHLSSTTPYLHDIDMNLQVSYAFTQNDDSVYSRNNEYYAKKDIPLFRLGECV